MLHLSTGSQDDFLHNCSWHNIVRPTNTSAFIRSNPGILRMVVQNFCAMALWLLKIFRFNIKVQFNIHQIQRLVPATQSESSQ